MMARHKMPGFKPEQSAGRRSGRKRLAGGAATLSELHRRTLAQSVGTGAKGQLSGRQRALQICDNRVSMPRAGNPVCFTMPR